VLEQSASTSDVKTGTVAVNRGTPLHPSGSPVVIEPTNTLMPISVRAVWDYRELLYFLIWRDLKVRYKQTVLGISWVILQPLLMTIIFTIFLGRLARVPSNGVPYLLLVYSGLTPWTLFSNAIQFSGNSLVANTNLITKVYFPRAIIPAAAVGARLVDFSVTLIIMLGLLIYYRVSIGWHLLMLPVFVLLIVLFSLGLGFWASAMNVKYRDVSVILPVVVQLWMFVSPVLYPLGIVPEKWKWLYSLNPMVGIIEGFRSSLLNMPFGWTAIITSAVITAIVLLYSMFAFKSMEKYFADTV